MAEIRREDLVIRGGGLAAFEVSQNVSFHTVDIGDAEVIFGPAFSPAPGQEDKPCTLNADCFFGTDNSSLRFQDYIKVVAANDFTGDGAGAFKNIGKVTFENYYFHYRAAANSEITAPTAFDNVAEVEVFSSWLKINSATPFARSGKTNVMLYQEGQLDISGIDGTLGDGCVIKNTYCTSYPDNTNPSPDTNFRDNNPARGLSDEFMSTTGDLAGKAASEEVTGYNLTVAAGSFKLINTDPTLYPIAYTIDPNCVDLIYDSAVRSKNPNISKNDIDPTAGTVDMSGFTKGYYIWNNNSNSFEAWIAAGETVTVKILPNPGYQYIANSVNVNGNFFETAADTAVGVYTYTMGPHAGHMSAGFIKTENLVKNNASESNIKSGRIANGGINAEMTLGTATPSNTSGFTGAADNAVFTNFIDIGIKERTVKNYDVSKANSEQAAWTEDKTTLASPATISIELDPNIYKGENFTVVRQHGGRIQRFRQLTIIRRTC